MSKSIFETQQLNW